MRDRVIPDSRTGRDSAATTLASTPRTVFISAAEPSADLHAANLIRAVSALDPAVRFVGVAGPQMQAAGCESVFDMTRHAAMLGGIFSVVPQAIAMLQKSRATLRGRHCDLAVVVDSPLLNMRVARRARNAGVPVLYFIAPQTWAWGANRLAAIKASVARMAVILPFEEPYFRERGIPADYVGHPLFDALLKRGVDESEVARLGKLGAPLIAIMPGSRTHVVDEVFPGQLEVAQAIARRFPHAHFCVSQANDRVESALRTRLVASGLPHSLHREANGEILRAADLALVASGTATLEVAFYRTPMIVMYNATRLGYHLYGRWKLITRYLSLVNILANRRLVPEYMPFYRSTAPIVADALGLLETPGALARVRQDLDELLAPIVKTGASANAARILLDMLHNGG